MAVTPASLVRHELVGLEVAVVAAPNPDLEGIQGEVVLETTKTVGICEAPRASESRTESGGDSGAADEASLISAISSSASASVSSSSSSSTASSRSASSSSTASPPGTSTSSGPSSRNSLPFR